ncbi:MAG TPA: alpha/beta hydrolase [Caulobacteraceae bacterium]|jgi:hypothetical protein|nr:alpha/beta hydrolase [Caulobacteraceae bacterium]
MTKAEGWLESDGVRLAWKRTGGAGPTLLWLGGFQSEMVGTKAEALAAWAEARGRDFLRFDYFGHGDSGGAFADGTITRWRADALAVLDRLTEGRVVLAGSSMGGWLACLAATARPDRVGALLLIAPAPDFTQRLTEGYRFTRSLLEDGARWSILAGPIPIEAPVRIVHGGEDTDAPWPRALELAMAIKGPDVVFSLVRDGGHRLSRPQDLERIIAFAEELTLAGRRTAG